MSELSYDLRRLCTARKTIKQKGSLGSVAEDLFAKLFCDTFGPDKSEYLFLQYPFTDLYGNRRSIDFALESET